MSYEEGGCPNMMTCNRCHGWKEIEYHPRTYKTRSCTVGRNCPKMQDCPFYHNAKDRSVIDASPYKESYKSHTPQIQKVMLTPDVNAKVAQTPFLAKKGGLFGFIPSENVAKVNHINSTTDDFVLHRGVSARTGLSANAVIFNNEKDDIDPRVMQFLSRRKIKHLKDNLVGITWEDLGSVFLDGKNGEDFSQAWKEEKEELDLASELFDHDIPKFIGLRSKKNFGNIPEPETVDNLSNKNIWGTENLSGFGSAKKINQVTFSSFPNVW